MNKPLHNMTLAGTATLGPKGQVVIPADVREKMNIKPGDKLIALYLDHKKAVGFIPEAQAQKMIDAMGAHMSELQSIITESDNK